MPKYSWFDDRSDKLRADEIPPAVPVNAAGLQPGYAVSTLDLPTLPNYGLHTIGDGLTNVDEWGYCDDGNVLYLVGGYVNGVSTQDSRNFPYLLRLNLATFTWLTAIDLPAEWANEGGWARYLDGFVYFGGGDGDVADGTSAWKFNTTTLAFTQLADCPISVDYGAVALVDGAIFVIDDSGDGVGTARYDPNTDTWEQLADIPSIGQDRSGSDVGCQVGRSVFWPCRNLRLDLDGMSWSLIVDSESSDPRPNPGNDTFDTAQVGTDIVTVTDSGTWILDGLTGHYTSTSSPLTDAFTAVAVRNGVVFTTTEQIHVRRWSLDQPKPAIFQAGRLQVGAGVSASGVNSVAEGSMTVASGANSHAEGGTSVASGVGSHAEGGSTTASGVGSHAEGSGTVSSGVTSHAEGGDTVASGQASHAEGTSTNVSGFSSHAEGQNTVVAGNYAHAEGLASVASGDTSHAEGQNAQALGGASHAEGYLTVASGDRSHAEGSGAVASGLGSHAEGLATASGDFAHAEGGSSVASGTSSHAEGQSTASGGSSHAEGNGSVASGLGSHAEGFITQALGESSHAQGFGSVATADKSHAEGVKSDARNHSSHAHGGPTFTADGIGESQYMRNQLACQTSVALPADMQLPDGLEAKLAPNRAAVVRALVVARDQAGTAAAGWTITGVVRVDGSGNGTLVGSATVTKVAGDSGTSSWTVALTAQAASIVRITVTGPAGVTIHWSANLEWQEIS